MNPVERFLLLGIFNGMAFTLAIMYVTFINPGPAFVEMCEVVVEETER